MFFNKYRIKISQGFGLMLLLMIGFTHRNFEDIEPIAEVLFFIGVTLVAIATLGRLWCSLHISGYKNRQLIQAGPYSICRHPLYFFSLLGGLGLGLATETITIPVIIFLGFFFSYPFVIHYEEKKLKMLFGAEYERYCQTTPQFFPKISLFNTSGKYLVNTDIFTKSLISSFWFIWGIGVLELLEALQGARVIPTLFKLY